MKTTALRKALTLMFAVMALGGSLASAGGVRNFGERQPGEAVDGGVRNFGE